MSHPVFALYNRALRLDSRTFSTYGRRGGLLAVIFFALLTAKQTSMLFGAPGLRFFQSVIMINCFYITVTGLSYFSSAITEEKEEQTLGLLRMTALSPVAILLGKSTTRLIATLLLLVAQVPFTLLAITLGGVSLDQIAAAYIALIAYTVLLCNAALFWSVIFKRTGNAAGMVGLGLLVFFAGPFWGQAMLDTAALGGASAKGGSIDAVGTAVFNVMKDMSVFMQLKAATSTGFSGSVIGFQGISNVIAGILFFLFSWLLFDRFTRTSAPAAPPRVLLSRRQGRKGLLRLFSPDRAWDRMPITWKDFTYTCGGITGVILRVLIVLGILVFVCYVGFSLNPQLSFLSSDFRDMVATTMIGTCIPIFVIELAFAASNIFQSEIRWNTLSSIGILPMSTGAMIFQKMVGYMIPSLPYVVIFMLGGLISPHVMSRMLDDVLTEAPGWYMISMVVMGLYLTVFFSIVLKRGALAVAFLAVFFGNMTFTMMTAFLSMWSGSGQAFLVLGTTVQFGVAVLLHTQIPGLLERKVAEA